MANTVIETMLAFYIDCFASKPHKIFFKTDFNAGIDKYNDAAQCVKSSY